LIRSSLVVEPAADGAPALTAIYRETVAFGAIQLRGPASIASAQSISSWPTCWP